MPIRGNSIASLEENETEVLGVASGIEAVASGLEEAGAGLRKEDMKPVDEQERLNTLVKAFKKLPAPEAERLGVDLENDGHIEPGSERAAALIQAWKNRQIELKQAVDAMVKPVELMAALLRHIQIDNSTSLPSSGTKLAGMSWSRADALEELEGLVDDIDNARDLHTIGGWRIITALLLADSQSRGDKDQSSLLTGTERALVAHVLGTATKNSYEFQLWMLEPMGEAGDASVARSKSVVMGLVDLLRYGGDEERRRAMYALSAAARGNPDVQEALQQPVVAGMTETDEGSYTDLVSTLYTMLGEPESLSVELTRKLWSFVADMLSEAAFLSTQGMELLAEMIANGVSEKDAISQLQELRPLGRTFCSSLWRDRLVQSLVAAAEDMMSSATHEGPSFNAQRAVVEALLAAVSDATTTCSSSTPPSFFSGADLGDVPRILEVLQTEAWRKDWAGDIANLAADVAAKVLP